MRDRVGRLEAVLSTCTVMVAALAVCAASAASVSAQTAPDTVVKRARAPTHAGIATLSSELAIGTIDGPAEYALGRVTEVLQMRDGSILVLDAPNGAQPEVRQFDGRGRYVRTIGRFGEGPGEYRSPGGLAQLPDGRILLLEGPGRRINVYSESGEPLATWALGEVVARSGGSGGLRIGRDGSVYASATVRRADTPFMTALRPAILRLTPDGRVAEILPDPELPDAGGMITRSTANSMRRSPIPYAPQAVRAFSPLGGYVTGLTSRYAFELRIPAAPRGRAPAPWTPADGVISIRRDVAPVAVSRAERAAQREFLEAQLEGPGALDRPLPDIPAAKPPYRRIDIGDDASIWITLSTLSERYDPPPPSASDAATMGVGRAGAAPTSFTPPRPVPWREPTLYDVFEPDGTYLGQVAVPFGTHLLRMRGDTAWGVTVDEDDVPTVHRFRIGWR